MAALECERNESGGILLRQNRFVSSSTEVVTVEESILDDDVRFFIAAVLSLSQWLPHYIEKIQNELYIFIENEEWNLNLGDPLVHVLTKNAKFSWRWIQEGKHLLEKFQIQILKCSDHLAVDDINTIFDSSPIKKQTLAYVSKINRLDYPILWLYTSDLGMKTWFSRRNDHSFYSVQANRAFQFNSIQETVNLSIDITSQRLQWDIQTPTDCQHAKQLVLSVYRLAVGLIKGFLQCEQEKLGLNRPDLHASGKVYRGEIMTREQWTTLKQRMSGTYEFSPKLFCQDYCSTTTSISTASGFSKSNRYIKIMHQLEIVAPEKEDLEKFTQLFPQYQIMCIPLKIDELSQFRDEKEVFMWKPIAMNLCFNESTDGSMILQSVIQAYYIDSDTFPDAANQNRMESELFEAWSRSRSGEEPDAKHKYFIHYPHQKERCYFIYISYKAMYKYVLQYFMEMTSQDFAKKIDLCHKAIKYFDDEIDFIKSICD